MTGRNSVECPACGQQVSAMGNKPMMHYVRGTSDVCSGEPKPCRACGEVPESVQDVASVTATGICYECANNAQG